jgi:ABC-type enterochelin transport system permease subunit
MKFKVFDCHERLYQWIAYISVVLSTIGGVVYYLVLKENSVAGK